MAKPKRTFSGQEGQRSVGTAGPAGISYDLDNLFAALDPDDTFKDGTPGGVGEENLRTDSISDRALGERTVDQSESPSSNTGLLTNVLSWFGNMIKKITGETNWFDTPATTLKAAKTHIDANAPHSGHIDAINNIQGGNITLKAGTNVEISQNTATKEVTIATSGTIAPSSHASSHAIGGADQITPASIGAAASTHTHTPASIGAVPAVSGKGLSTNDFTTALLNKLNGIDEGAQVNQTIHIETGTVDHQGTIPLPSGFTRAQCKYFLMPKGEIQVGGGEGLAILDISVNQSTGFVFAKAYGTGTMERNLELSYVTIAIKD